MRTKVITSKVLFDTIRQLPEFYETNMHEWLVQFVVAITWAWSSIEDTTSSCIPPWEHPKSLAEALKDLKDVAKRSGLRETPIKKMRI